MKDASMAQGATNRTSNKSNINSSLGMTDSSEEDIWFKNYINCIILIALKVHK